MTETLPLDASWLATHPLPKVETASDKNGRGRVLLVGGARFVPGALALTGEAILRVGAGKLQMATVEAVALALGVLVPEAAMVGLPMREDGEIAPEAVALIAELVSRCDTLLAGPGMSATADTSELVKGLIDLSPPAVLLDAAALTCARITDLAIAASRMPLVLTPHLGEMARLMDCPPDVVTANPEAMLLEMVRLTGAVIALKGSQTWIGGPGVPLLHYTDGCPGLGIGGSGDVLAGIIGGLLARGTPPYVATAWGVALHGAAGQQAAKDIGATGFLARELLPRLPRLLDTF
jgi:ADP-dependent NAD(P)H-hydrate dehydratase